MIKNKTPLYETNFATSQYVPTVETDNPALNHREVDNLHYNGTTIVQMRETPELFDKSSSGLDKLAIVRNAANKNIPEVKKASKQFSDIKKALRK